jgi:hypothetical protein
MAYFLKQNSLSQVVYCQGQDKITFYLIITHSFTETERTLLWLLEALGSQGDLQHLSALHLLGFLVLLEYPALLLGLEVLIGQYLATLALP